MSAKIRYISDPHFGHAYAAKARGFSSTEKHDYHIVDSINSVMKKGDTLWILGDITMEKKAYYDILDEIKGYKKIVLGNHDRPQDVPELLKHVNCVCGAYKLGKFWLTHMPLDKTELVQYNEYNIHGHIHEKDPPTRRHFNVSADYIDYVPLALEEILHKFKR